MAEGLEIAYTDWIERLILDFRPVKRLWPVGVRLTLWLLVAVGIAGSGLAAVDVSDLGAAIGQSIWQPAVLAALAPLLLATIAAAYLALRSTIPDRAASALELVLAATLTAVGLAAPQVAGLPAASGAVANHAGGRIIVQMLGLAAGPCLALIWAVRRGFATRPRATAGLIGAAGGGCALLTFTVLSPTARPPAAAAIGAWSLIVLLNLAFAADALNRPGRRYANDQLEAVSRGWNGIGRQSLVSLGVALSVAIAILVPRAGLQSTLAIPDFDLAIAGYQRSLAGFRANVPSGSIDEVVTAYVERGMPAYMWDFVPQGFPLVGGRFDRLRDGTPLSYTLFRGPRGGVLCIFKRTDAFIAPLFAHQEKRHLLFYRYRGYSLCLINVGGYGNFLSVVVAPMPMQEFMSLVLKAVF